MSDLRAPDEPFLHCELLYRHTGISDEFGVSVETSLSRSNVTGGYLLQQVLYGRHGTTTNTISLGLEALAGLMPFLEEIAGEVG